MPGRKAKSIGLKVLSGSQKCRIPKHKARKNARPIAPPHLSGDALAEWERIIPLIEETGVLTAADGPALAIYCVAFERWLRACENLACSSLYLLSETGATKTNPSAAIAAKAEITMLRVLSSFGLDPTARNKTAVQAEGPQDELDTFMRKKPC